jgi:hypothetical protein
MGTGPGSERPLAMVIAERAAEDGAELPLATRLRILADLLASLDPATPISPRTGASRLHLREVRLQPDGSSTLFDVGDRSGVAELCWEVLASRPRGVETTRVHDLVDEMHPDVDDLVERALRGEVESVGELIEALEREASGAIGRREDVASLFFGAVAMPSEVPAPEALAGSTPAHPDDAPPEHAGRAGALSPPLAAPESPVFVHASAAPDVPSVLLIGLEGEDREAVSAILRERGLRVHTTSIEGWQRARRPKRLGCIVTCYSAHLFDLFLSLRTGPLRATPIVVLSPAEHVTEASSVGPDVCLALPCPAGDLIAAIEDMLSLDSATLGGG